MAFLNFSMCIDAMITLTVSVLLSKKCIFILIRCLFMKEIAAIVHISVL